MKIKNLVEFAWPLMIIPLVPISNIVLPSNSSIIGTPEKEKWTSRKKKRFMYMFAILILYFGNLSTTPS